MHVSVDLGGCLFEVFSSDAGNAFSEFLGVDASVVVHEVVSSGLSQIVLGLVVHDLVVDLPLGPLQLLVSYLCCVIYVKINKLE